MKTTTSSIISILAGAGAMVSATPLKRATNFDISNFNAGTLPYGTGAAISFDVSIPQHGIKTTCSYSDAHSRPTLPEVPQGSCEDEGVSFQFQQDPSGPPSYDTGDYRLIVKYDDGEGGALVGGDKGWDVDEFPVKKFEGKGEAQTFVGEGKFKISV